MRSLLGLVVLSAVVTFSDSGECPDGNLKGLGENDCYLLRATEATRDDADEDCIRQNGMLASIPNAFVNALLASKTPSGGVWLGAAYTDGYESSRGFYWEDGTAFVYMNWAKGHFS